MPALPVLAVLLAESALRYARPHVGADGKRWREAMATAAPRERRAAIERGGPRIDGDLLTLDPDLCDDALAALEILAMQGMHRAALVRADLGELEDALVAARAGHDARRRRDGG
jgi:hypothetical protein